MLGKGASAHIARWISHSLGNNKDSPLPLPLLSGNKRTRVRSGFVSRRAEKTPLEQSVDTTQANASNLPLSALISTILAILAVCELRPLIGCAPGAVQVT